MTTYLDMSVALPDPGEPPTPQQQPVSRWGRSPVLWVGISVLVVSLTFTFFIIFGAPFASASGGCGGG